jgi:PHD/YefM family antitoxin component YafN of YafNO toxin-antitoxin module
MWYNYGLIVPTKEAAMPTILPIKELKNTAKISRIVQEADEPVFVTKNGYGDMVVMNMRVYEQTMMLNNLYAKLTEAENDFASGATVDAFTSLDSIHARYGL